MEYKTKFRPLERLGPDGWHRFDEEDQPANTAPPAIRLRELV
jgi:arginyl-tRNA--protein-N-Asp/Glu arginylyltransferase